MSVKRMKKSKGLSLVEVLISFSVLTVGILAVLGVFPAVFENNANTWENIIVMNLAQEKMDEILSWRDYISETPEIIYPDTIPDPSGYIKWWGEADPEGNDEIQIIHVEVCWIKKGRVKTYKLVSAVHP